MNDDLTIAQKREIDDEIGNVLKKIKMNEYKIYEAKEMLKTFSDTNFDEKLEEIESSSNTKTNEPPKKGDKFDMSSFIQKQPSLKN